MPASYLLFCPKSSAEKIHIDIVEAAIVAEQVSHVALTHTHPPSQLSTVLLNGELRDNHIGPRVITPARFAVAT